MATEQGLPQSCLISAIPVGQQNFTLLSPGEEGMGFNGDVKLCACPTSLVCSS